MSHLVLVEDYVLYCSLVCAREDLGPMKLKSQTKEITSIKEYVKLNWEWTEEDGQGSLYGELCPVCETNYQDALDPCGVLERY